MQIKKWIATGLSALMAGATIAGAGLAATSLKDFPGFLGLKSATGSALDAFVVVGADAKPSDVVGAVDLAARLAELSYTLESVKGGAVTGFQGVDRDGIRIGTTSNGDPLYTGGVGYSNPFSGGAVVKNFHWSTLKDSTFTWRSSTYDFSEQFDLSGVRMRHDFGTSDINGSLTMEVESKDIIYQYVFEKSLAGTGSQTDKNLTYPVNIELLGKPFSVVGVGSNQVVMLTGSIGTADATKGVTYGDYTAYATLGSNDKWAKVVLQDKAGTTVDTLVVNEGDTKTSSVTSLDVKVTDARALADGTVVGVDLVLGPQGQTEKTYDTGADTTSTGSASDRFPGETDWGVRVAGSNFSTAGELTANHMLEVVYQPTSTKYLKAGGKVDLPNNFGFVQLVGYGIDKWATITIKQITSQSVYNSTGDIVAAGAATSLNGLEISSVDETGKSLASIVASNGNTYDKAYVLVGKQLPSGANPYPVYFGFYDSANKRIKAADLNVSVGDGRGANTFSSVATTGNTSFSGVISQNAFVLSSEFGAVMLNRTQGNNVTYSYRLSYGGSGEKSDYRLNITLDTNNNRIFGNVTAGDLDNFLVRIGFENKTTWDTSTVPEFRLGATATTSDSNEINVTTEGTKTINAQIGKSSQDVLDDTGIIVLKPDSNGAQDTVKLQIGSRDPTARVKIGKEGGDAPTLGTVNKIAPITSAVAKLDSEIGTAEKAKHLVLVGGPAVNKLTAEALGKTYPAKGAASGIAENTAIIRAVDDAFSKGRVALVVAGYEADNTRIATSVLQNYGAHLKDVKGSKVTITGTAAVPIVKEG